MKPILFNAEMVRAILDGRKTVTRRVVKAGFHRVYKVASANGKWNETFCDEIPDEISEWYAKEKAKPPYQPSDVLWVRETWNKNIHGYNYRASMLGSSRDRYPWKPSIHMPREAARLFLRVTDVRVERLRDITEDGALAEGVPNDWPMEAVYCPICRGEGLIGAVHPVSLGYMEVDCPHCEKATVRFENLWNTTIKPADLPCYGWDANPWVWVIEFERCEKPAGEE